MPAILSTIDDESIGDYLRRAKISSMGDISFMENTNWRSRLSAAIEQSGKSMRAVSVEAGLDPSYVHSMLSRGKEPTIEKLMAVCDAVPVSLPAILYGYKITAEDEALLEALKESPKVREALLALVQSVGESRGHDAVGDQPKHGQEQ